VDIKVILFNIVSNAG